MINNSTMKDKQELKKEIRRTEKISKVVSAKKIGEKAFIGQTSRILTAINSVTFVTSSAKL